jgi:hypothetical protein
MGCWDEVCLICGLCPGGGPDRLFSDLDEMLDEIIKNLQEQDLDLDLDENGLREEIRNLLMMFDDGEDGNDETGYEKAIKEGTILPGTWFPFAYEGWDGWGAIAIGVFDEEHEANPAKGYVSTVQIPFSSTD